MGRRAPHVTSRNNNRNVVAAVLVPFVLGILVVITLSRSHHLPDGLSGNSPRLDQDPPTTSSLSQATVAQALGSQTGWSLERSAQKAASLQSKQAVPGFEGQQQAGTQEENTAAKLTQPKPQLFLFIGVLSGRGYRHRRLAVREGWANQAQHVANGTTAIKFILSEDERTPQVSCSPACWQPLHRPDTWPGSSACQPAAQHAACWQSLTRDQLCSCCCSWNVPAAPSVCSRWQRRPRSVLHDKASNLWRTRCATDTWLSPAAATHAVSVTEGPHPATTHLFQPSVVLQAQTEIPKQIRVDLGCAGAPQGAVNLLLSVSMGCAGQLQAFGQHSVQRLVVWRLFQCRQGWCSDLDSCPRTLCKQAIRQHLSTALTCELASAGADVWNCLWGQCRMRQQVA